MDLHHQALVVWLGFSAIASLTWFFSSRPRLLIRVSFPKSGYREAVRTILREPRFCVTMRMMSLFQFGVGVACAFATLSGC